MQFAKNFTNQICSSTKKNSIDYNGFFQHNVGLIERSSKQFNLENISDLEDKKSHEDTILTDEAK